VLPQYKQASVAAATTHNTRWQSGTTNKDRASNESPCITVTAELYRYTNSHPNNDRTTENTPTALAGTDSQCWPIQHNVGPAS
jgi:hypothetical protein